MKKIILATAIGALALAAWAAAEAKADRPAIYDPAADSKAQINAALVKAKAENRHLLLMFGGNWCPWCHRLHALLQSDARLRDLLEKSFCLIMVDVGEKAGEPLNADLVQLYRVQGLGYPALAVLADDGKIVAVQSSGVLEKGKGHDPEKVLAFLNLEGPPAR
jgi:thioredoxin-related protein